MSWKNKTVYDLDGKKGIITGDCNEGLFRALTVSFEGEEDDYDLVLGNIGPGFNDKRGILFRIESDGGYWVPIADTVRGHCTVASDALSFPADPATGEPLLPASPEALEVRIEVENVVLDANLHLWEDVLDKHEDLTDCEARTLFLQFFDRLCHTVPKMTMGRAHPMNV